MWIGCVQDLAISKRLALIERTSCVPRLNPVSLGPAVFKTFQKIAVTKKKKKQYYTVAVSIGETQNQTVALVSHKTGLRSLLPSMPSIWLITMKEMWPWFVFKFSLKKKKKKKPQNCTIYLSVELQAACFDDGNGHDCVGQHPVCLCVCVVRLIATSRGHINPVYLIDISANILILSLSWSVGDIPSPAEAWDHCRVYHITPIPYINQ